MISLIILPLSYYLPACPKKPPLAPTVDLDIRTGIVVLGNVPYGVVRLHKWLDTSAALSPTRVALQDLGRVNGELERLLVNSQASAAAAASAGV